MNRKVNTYLCSILTTVLILFGAMLPRVVGQFLDRASLEDVKYAEIPSIRLDIREDRTALDTIGMLLDTEALDVDESMMSSTAAQIRAIAIESLEQYQKAQLVSPFTPDYIEVRPTLCVNPSAPTISVLCWAVIIQESEHLVMMTIDDASGCVLSISYDTGNTWFEDRMQQKALTSLCELYFSGLDLTVPPQQIRPEAENEEANTRTNNCFYQFYHESHGEITFEFLVFSSGFYIHIFR